MNINWIKRYWEVTQALDYRHNTKEKLEMASGYRENIYRQLLDGALAYEAGEPMAAVDKMSDITSEMVMGLRLTEITPLEDNFDEIVRLAEQQQLNIQKAMAGEHVTKKAILWAVFDFVSRADPKLLEGHCGTWEGHRLFPQVKLVAEYKGHLIADMYKALALSNWVV